MGVWVREVDAWSRWARAGGLSEGTIRLRRYWLLDRCAPVVGARPYQVSADQLVDWLASLQVAPETRKSARASLRVFYSWALLEGRTQVDPTVRLRPVRVPPTRPRPAPLDVLPDRDRVDVRVELMLLLALYAGLRRAEIAGLHTRDVTAEGLRIVGKGGRVRVVPMHPVLEDRLGMLPAGYVFPSTAGGHLTPDRVGRLMSAALGPGWSAHTLRHRFATRLYETSGHDLLAVQQLLGHASPATTQRYTLVTSRHLAAAVAAA